MKTKTTQSPAVSFMDAAARVDLVALTAKALLTPVAVAVVVLARVARAVLDAYFGADETSDAETYENKVG